jgi:hypothetical protein
LRAVVGLVPRNQLCPPQRHTALRLCCIEIILVIASASMLWLTLRDFDFELAHPPARRVASPSPDGPVVSPVPSAAPAVCPWLLFLALVFVPPASAAARRPREECSFFCWLVLSSVNLTFLFFVLGAATSPPFNDAFARWLTAVRARGSGALARRLQSRSCAAHQIRSCAPALRNQWELIYGLHPSPLLASPADTDAIRCLFSPSRPPRLASRLLVFAGGREVASICDSAATLVSGWSRSAADRITASIQLPRARSPRRGAWHPRLRRQIAAGSRGGGGAGGKRKVYGSKGERLGEGGRPPGARALSTHLL